VLPGVKDADVEKKLPAAFKKAVAENHIALYLIDPTSTGLTLESPELDSLILQTAFLRVALGKSEEVGLQKLATTTGSDIKTLEQVAADLEKTLRQIEVPSEWTELEVDAKVSLPVDITANSFSPFDKTEEDPPSKLRSWQKAAKGFLFKEAYNTSNALRPDLPTKTFTVHVKENRRLTPVTYDRNIFHIEFDLGTSGLKYEIGEALGIHAENDHNEVIEFIKWYGLNPDDVVEVASREDPVLFENRTVYQALKQNLDIFGRPPKKFYEALAEYATDEIEKKNLLTLAGPEGYKEFQRRAEVDTVTYADVLLEFPSAHPSFHDLARIVSPMKRREYSIASCQAVTPNSVALMIVVVNWVDSKGRDRFGQATKYLSALKAGAPVTVSVKPSVMRLPPKSTQPIIMAGLGTGLAPFRAFVQHRAMEKAQGKEIGSVLLYMGSRHQREEYCYGEEWEAYQAAGVITLLGRAFSRDQPEKIYIQDRMRQTIDDIVKAYIKEEGAFYLCGPTWPVPDVTDVLEEAIARDAKDNGIKKIDTAREIMKLKDTGRYVLEVY
jgi:sulfite reductase (NADPH) flavoprotein alpha-component